MEFVKEWTFMICITLISAVVLSMLSPKSTMGRYFKLILAVLIFVSFLHPLKNGNFDIDFPEFDSLEYSEKNNEAYENIISNKIESVLSKKGYEFTDVSCDIFYNENEIEVRSLKICITDSMNKEEVREYVRNETGFDAEVYYLGE